MLPWDQTYIDAKEIITGKRTLQKEFQILKDFLDEEFGVELINADFYKEPVFKKLPISLRLILDFTKMNGKLPVFNAERKRMIGDVFIELLRENKIDKYQKLTFGGFNVRYIDVNYLRFEEALRHVSADIRSFDTDITDILIGGHTFFILYSNTETLIRKKELKQEFNILETVVDHVQKKGYSGEYLKMVQVILDETATVEKAGGPYYYIR